MLHAAMASSERGGAFPSGSAVAPFPQHAAALEPVVRAVVAAVLGERRDHPDVEDCSHETMRRALEGQARLREGEPLRPWLIGIARHVALDARRKRRRERVVGDASEAEPLWEQLADPAPAPDERAVKAEQSRRITAAMEGLSRQQREAMVLFHVEGRAYQEIAERLGVPIGTVATWLSRGRRTLADALGEAGEQ